MDFGPVQWALVTLAGSVVGILAGLFGIGGGFLVVPVLSIVLSIPMPLAVGAGVCHVLGPATTALLARGVRREHLKLPLTIAGGLFVGVFWGAWCLQWAKGRGEITVNGSSVPWADLLVLSTYFVLLLSVGLFALWDVRRSRAARSLGPAWMAHWRVPPYARFVEFDQPRVSITVVAWFGLAVGLVAGLLGMSGGLVLLPGLIYLLGMRTHQAVMSSQVIVWLVAFQATVVHAWHENISLTLVMALLLGGTVGARIGSELSQKLGGRRLRQGFGWLLVGTAAIIGARLGKLLLW